jgi:hypothetical protein
MLRPLCEGLPFSLRLRVSLTPFFYFTQSGEKEIAKFLTQTGGEIIKRLAQGQNEHRILTIIYLDF